MSVCSLSCWLKMYTVTKKHRSILYAASSENYAEFIFNKHLIYFNIVGNEIISCKTLLGYILLN